MKKSLRRRRAEARMSPTITLEEAITMDGLAHLRGLLTSVRPSVVRRFEKQLMTTGGHWYA